MTLGRRTLVRAGLPLAAGAQPSYAGPSSRVQGLFATEAGWLN
ncbi:MAG: hypothetical protein ACT6S0_10240 [Roseateles sp.]